jgi:acyl dehydratase
MRIINGLDELESLAGTVLGTSDWFTVTQDVVNAFSELTGDHQWIHLDVERATRELAIGGPIVQGLLTLSLIVKFRNEIAEVRGVTRVINYGLNRVRFPAPVLVGTRLRGTQTLLSAERRQPDVLRLTSSIEIEAEGVVKPACVAESVSLVYG